MKNISHKCGDVSTGYASFALATSIVENQGNMGSDKTTYIEAKLVKTLLLRAINKKLFK